MPKILRVSSANIYKSRDALTYLFNIFTFVGTNPLENRSRRYYCVYYFYSFTVNFICCLFCPLSFHIGYIKLRSVLTNSQLLAAIQNAVQVSGIPIKIFVITWYMKRLRHALEILDELDVNYTQHEDLAKIRECVQRCRKIVLIFCLPYYSFEVSTIALGVLQNRAPLAAWVPFLDGQRAAWEYWTIVLWDSFIMFILLCHQLGSDTYPPIFINIIRTHIQLLMLRVSRLGRADALTANQHYEELVACIRSHVQIVSIAKIVAPVISVTLFTQFATTATTLLNWLGNVEYPENIISLAFFSCQLLQILPCCSSASQLIADCERLPDAIFHCNWVNKDRRFRKAILFFLQCTQTPIRFSCLKLFDVKLATSVAIGKFAFSLYTLIEETKVGTDAEH
ncbi:putative odorant receptor 59c [Bactrocera oleae]|uniref:putative odorant receptor 59c n=1 Tax=Bactrocera oleae TaxID=104688 RepID=UPI00387E4D48